MTNTLFRQLSIFLTIAVITLFPGVANAGQVSVHNATNQPITCDASGGIRNTVKQNMQRILLSPGQTLALNPQDFSTQTIARVECTGYNVENLNVTPNSPERYLSFTGQAQQTLSVLLYPYLPTTPEANFQPMVQPIVNEFQQKKYPDFAQCSNDSRFRI